MRTVVYALLALLYLLHNDVWYWNDPAIVLGLPIGITYHLVWTLAVSLCFGLVVRYAWPEELETIEAPGPPAAAAESGETSRNRSEAP